MENQSLAYSAKDLLARLQGPAMLQIIANSADLRMLVDSLEGIGGLADYYAETEQRLYPDLAPKRKGPRHNRVRVVVKQEAHVLPEETRDMRILAFVERWMKKHKQAPTMREIRNNHRSWEDMHILVGRLVDEGRLCVIAGERTAYYTLPKQTEETTN
jgi:hypothetical protein